jgi:hypothetical protein
VSSALRLEEAVDLGYALMARVAQDAGVRLLAIKGPVLALQGLRAPKRSVDVDVLVDPAGFDRMRAALEAVGWHDGGLHDTPHIVPMHSVTHRHPVWPLEVDVHRWFPGFLGDPQATFEALWERRSTVVLAHVELPAPDAVGHCAIAALHYLRDSATEWSRGNLADLAERVATWDAGERVALGELASRTGSAETLAPFLRAVDVATGPSGVPLVVSLDDWETRSDAETRQVLPWLVELRRRPWYRRPAYVLWSLWLTDDHFRTQSDVPLTRREVMRARVARLRRGLRALPAARADLARRTRGR